MSNLYYISSTAQVDKLFEFGFSKDKSLEAMRKVNSIQLENIRRFLTKGI